MYFNREISLKAAKELYHDLLIKNHPDHGGSNEITAEIIKSFEEFCMYKMQHSFDEAGDDKTGSSNVNAFSEILKEAMHLNCRIEIIGFWIYAFDSYLVRNELADLGFFFSSKHKAWIYNGGRRRAYHTRLTTDDNRRKWGYEIVREKETQEAIA